MWARANHFCHVLHIALHLSLLTEHDILTSQKDMTWIGLPNMVCFPLLVAEFLAYLPVGGRPKGGGEGGQSLVAGRMVNGPKIQKRGGWDLGSVAFESGRAGVARGIHPDPLHAIFVSLLFCFCHFRCLFRAFSFRHPKESKGLERRTTPYF